MSQSAESGAAVVPEWYASLPKHNTVWVVAERMRAFTCGWWRSEGRRGGEVSYVEKLLMEIMLLKIILINIYQFW